MTGDQLHERGFARSPPSKQCEGKWRLGGAGSQDSGDAFSFTIEAELVISGGIVWAQNMNLWLVCRRTAGRLWGFDRLIEHGRILQ
jgi:hypothetical protein